MDDSWWSNHYLDRDWNYRARKDSVHDYRLIPTKEVKTMDAKLFEDGKHGAYFVLGKGTNRSWKKTVKEAIEHAQNLLQDNSSDELLVVKVVKRVKKKPYPIEVIDVK